MTDEEKLALADKVLACKKDEVADKWIIVPGHTHTFYAYDLLNKLLTDGPYS